MEVVFAQNPIQESDPRLARQFEHVVVEALRGCEALGQGGAPQARFHVWDGEGGPRYVCKIEFPSTASLQMDEPPWRWWSSLVETPQELGQSLREAVRTRIAQRRRQPEERRPSPALERWGWAGEMRLS